MIWLWVWGIVTAINLVIEFWVSNLFMMWFSAGGLVTLLVVALVPGIFWIWQFVIFAVVSALLLLVVRRFCIKWLNTEKEDKTKQGE